MKRLSYIIAATLSLSVVLLAQPVSADIFGGSKNVACGGAQLGASQPCDSSVSGKANNLLALAINILSLVVGVASIITIIIAGLRYVTSGGDSNNVSGAKNALLYALIGLVVVALAQTLTHFVINRANSAVQCPTNQTLQVSGACG